MLGPRFAAGDEVAVAADTSLLEVMGAQPSIGLCEHITTTTEPVLPRQR